MRTRLIYFTVLLACPVMSEVILERLSLAKAEEIALEYNKQFLIAREGTVEAKERKLQAISRYLPSINYNAEFHQMDRFEYFFDVFATSFSGANKGYLSILQLDQPLLSTKLIFGLKAKQLEEQSSHFEQANTKNELLLALRDSYYAVALYDQALEIQRVNVGYLSEALLQEQQKLDAGNSTPYEVNQSKAALANSISLYYETLRNVKRARNALIIALGVDPLLEPDLSLENDEIPLFSIPEIALKLHTAKKKYLYGSGAMPTTEEMLLHIERIEEAKKLTLFSESEVMSYLELALQARPDLQKSRLRVGIAEQNLRTKQGQYLPEISGYLRYSYNDIYPGTTPFFQETYDLSGGFYLNWKLFDSFLREHEIREASSQKRSARISFDKDLQAIEVQIRNALYQFEESLFAFLSSNEAVLVAEQAREQAQDKLAYGRIPPLEYRDSVNQLAQARNLRNRSSFDLMAAYYELRYATGQDMNPSLIPYHCPGR